MLPYLCYPRERWIGAATWPRLGVGGGVDQSQMDTGQAVGASCWSNKLPVRSVSDDAMAEVKRDSDLDPTWALGKKGAQNDDFISYQTVVLLRPQFNALLCRQFLPGTFLTMPQSSRPGSGGT